MLQTITNASVQLVNRYLPSPFVFSVVLTFIAFVAGLVLTGQPPMQMALILVVCLFFVTV